MVNVFKKPLLHFLLIGGCVYLGQQWLQQPERPLTKGPSAQQIELIRKQWHSSTGRMPTEQQLQQMLADKVDEEILYREALKRQWHLTDSVIRQRLIGNMRFFNPQTQDDDDTLIDAAFEMNLHENELVVRRRLIQLMKVLASVPVRQTQPAEGELQRLYLKKQKFQQQELKKQELQQQGLGQKAQYMESALISFSHIFIGSDKHPNPFSKAEKSLEQLTKTPAPVSKKFSDPFLLGLSFSALSEAQVDRYFGAGFARSLFSLEGLGKWSGPLESSYGVHLVFIEEKQAQRLKSFSQVEEQLRYQWRRSQEKEALRLMLTELRKQYEVSS